ncbi:MAG: double zinc ribbon domain-containing protein [Syntrophaceae bacterium]
MLDTILPPRCLACGSSDRIVMGVCAPCTDRLRTIAGPLCDICGVELGTPGTCLACSQTRPPYDMLRGVYRFEGLLVDLIHAFKYGRATTLKRFLGWTLAEAVAQWGVHADIITFVPMHWTKVVERGYNQSALLAKEVCARRGVTLSGDVLRKTRRTAAQAGLARKGRQRNVAGAFAATGMRDKSVMVVDDVITTASTAYEVAVACKKAGAASVAFVGLGRVL